MQRISKEWNGKGKAALQMQKRECQITMIYTKSEREKEELQAG